MAMSGRLNCFLCSSRRRHTRFALGPVVQTCALPISPERGHRLRALGADLCRSHLLHRPCVDQHRSRHGGADNRHAHLLTHSKRKELSCSLVVALSARSIRKKQIGALLPELSFGRSEEHTSELQSLMRISYAVFCLKKKKS